MNRVYLTKEGYEKLRSELEKLEKEERPVVIEAIATARKGLVELKQDMRTKRLWYRNLRSKRYKIVGVADSAFKNIESKYSLNGYLAVPSYPSAHDATTSNRAGFSSVSSTS